MGTFVPRLSCSERNLQQKLAIAGIGVVWVVERFLFVIGLVKTNMKAKCELSKYKKKKSTINACILRDLFHGKRSKT